jgi:hypothetical protein
VARDADLQTLRNEQQELLREADEITRLVSPLLDRRERLTRRASAIEVLLRPLDEAPPELTEMRWKQQPIERSWEEGVRRVVHYVPRATRRRAQRELFGWLNAAGEPPGNASAVIRDILDEAKRPLHRSEILLRSRLHPLGPLNQNTMSTRLSRDTELFEKAKPRKERAGYWVLKEWPPEVKEAALDPAGREYAEAVALVEAEELKLLHLQQDLALSRRRLAEIRFEDAEGMASASTAAEGEKAIKHIGLTEYQINRKLSVIAAARDRALTAWKDLGAEAEKYPLIQTRNEAPSDNGGDEDTEWVDVTPPDTWEMFSDETIGREEGGSG